MKDNKINKQKDSNVPEKKLKENSLECGGKWYMRNTVVVCNKKNIMRCQCSKSFRPQLRKRSLSVHWGLSFWPIELDCTDQIGEMGNKYSLKLKHY